VTLVVGYVPNQAGFRAVEEAAREARSRDVAVVVVNVVGAAGYALPTAADDCDLDAVTAHLTENGVRNSRRRVIDDVAPPASAILRVAHDVDASLIVLGLRKRSRIARRLLGGTAQTVVLAAPCPVLIVPNVDHGRDRCANCGFHRSEAPPDARQ
jgi:nucleotide-binding universal stress UspA family protein